MKKLIAVLTLAAMLAALSLVSFADASEAIADGGFEDGIGNVYANDGAVVIEKTDAAYFTGNGSLAMTGRTNEWGAAAWNVTDYVAEHGDGQFYCTFDVLGAFDGFIRATLHTTYSDGRDFYRQIGDLTPFTANTWTKIGLAADGTAAPLRIENWAEEDHSKWDPIITAEGISNATLYFWIEGDNYGNIYFDNMNFWGEKDTPVDYTANGANTTAKVLDLTVISDTTMGLIDDDTETTAAATTEAPVTGQKADTSAAVTTAADTAGTAEKEGGVSPAVIIAIVAAVVIIAAAVIVICKKKK